MTFFVPAWVTCITAELSETALSKSGLFKIESGEKSMKRGGPAGTAILTGPPARPLDLWSETHERIQLHYTRERRD